MNPYTFILIAIALLPFVFRREIAAWRRARRDGPHRRADAAAWRTEFEANNPDGPPFTPGELEEFRAWRATLALPAVELLPAPGRAVKAGGTRLGGPVWLADGEAWPADAEGLPLEFVAQVDFAELPPLPDFPTTGLLQFFVGTGDVFGADFDEPANGSARVLWRPDGPGGGRLQPPPHRADGMSPFEGDNVRAAGLSLIGQGAEHLPDGTDWRIIQRLEGHLRRPGIDEVDEMIQAQDDTPPVRHHVGGHPVFTQFDFREPGRGDELDRTLLRLTSDATLRWGDCGEAMFLISRDALLARDFASVAFYWDCT